MQDFSGQGEALIGWLDSFYDSKGTTDTESFRRYCAPTVPLLKLPGYIYKTSESPTIEALVHHYGEKDITQATATWVVKTKNGKVIDQGSLKASNITNGAVTSIGSFVPDFSAIKKASQVSLTIKIPDEKITNSYALWIYPEIKPLENNSSLLITSDWEAEAKPALAEGKNVLLIANQLGGPKASKLAHWFPLYWSVPFFPGQNRETIGLRVTADHPAFFEFPTLAHGDWNWHRICRGARGFDLTDVTPNKHRPIAEPVTDFHHNRRLASIFETKVENGKLLVCGYNISVDQAKKLPEVAQLRQSLIRYSSGKKFDPKIITTTEALDKLFYDPTIKLQKLPAKFTNADLYVNAAGKLATQAKSVPWTKGRDQILRQAEGVDYAVKCDGTWRDKGGSAWHGKNITVTMTPRAGVPGKFLVRFHDWNKNGRTGVIIFEGKTHQLAAHIEGGWVELPVIREDTNDTRLVLTAKALTGPNLMITDIAFVAQE